MYRRAQSRELALQIAGSCMARDTARIGYFMMVCPKLEYPLAVTQFTQQQCDNIISPVIRASLSKMGYNCNMPKEVTMDLQRYLELAFTITILNKASIKYLHSSDTFAKKVRQAK
jgi:hypothetical protein